MSLSTLLYVSDLAPNTSILAVATIARAARTRNERDGISGLLTFDGARFAQLVDGPSELVGDLLGRLLGDNRHCAIEVLSFEPLQSDRHFMDWRLGFIEVPARCGIDSLRGKKGPEALSAFLTMLAPLSADPDIALLAASHTEAVLHVRGPYASST